MDLRKEYKSKVAVADVSLRLEPGQTLGILGMNGAGKTTTVEMIAGLRKPTSGRVSVLGLDPQADRAKVRTVLGVQLQDSTLHSALTVREMIRLYASFYPHPRPIDEAVEMVDLSGQADTRFGKLSGGQKQRLSVALALVGRPRVAILDELSTGLDPRTRRRIWATIERLREDGVAIVLVSHAMDEVERLCDQVLVMDAGSVVAAGTPAEIARGAGASNLEEAFVAITGHDAEDLEGTE